MIVSILLTALVFGFLAGLFAFRAKSRWCPRCGSWTHRERVAADGRVALP
jgi:hypothetical protein